MKFLDIKVYEDNDITRDDELDAVINLETIEAIKESREWNPNTGYYVTTYRVYFYRDPLCRFTEMRIVRRYYIDLKKHLKGRK